LRLRQVDDRVASDTHVASSAVHDGVTESRLNGGSTVRLSFTDRSGTKAAAVVSAAAHEALATIAQQQLDAGTEAVNAAQASATAALTALSDLNGSVGAEDVEADYGRHSQNLINLQNQEAVTPSSGLAAAIASEQANVAKLAPAIPRYLQLKAASDSAQATLAAADQVLTAANGVVAAAQSPSVLTTPSVGRASRAGLMARVGGAGAVAAVLIVFGLFVAADRRRVRRVDTTAADPHPVEPVGGHGTPVAAVAGAASAVGTDHGAPNGPGQGWRRSGTPAAKSNGGGDDAAVEAGSVVDRAPG
jgi:hypothetical protein